MEKFEQSWREALIGAEASPAEGVWNNIDHTLTTAEKEVMKKRIVLYQRLAAASVLFAMLIGSFGIYRWNEHSIQLTQNKSKETSVKNERDLISRERQANSAQHVDKEKLGAQVNETQSDKLSSTSKSNTSLPLNSSGDKLADADATKKFIEHNSSQPKELPDQTIKNGKINPNKRFSQINLAELGGLELLPGPRIHEGPIRTDILRKLPAIPGAFLARTEKKAAHEQVWASVTAAAGSYNPNTNLNSNYSYSANQASSISNSSSAVGASYSFGMLAGMRVARRVVLQSGIQYLNQSINSTSNISSSNSLALVASSLDNSSQNYATTSPYSISSANEFVSVPVQAGYLFIDKKVGLQLNSGVSSDFFIRNTLSDPSGQRQSYSQNAGQDSPYRSVNFSALVNSEVSYKMGSHYRVSVVPGFHYSFSPLLKSANASGNPFVWDVGFRFRYIFK